MKKKTKRKAKATIDRFGWYDAWRSIITGVVVYTMPSDLHMWDKIFVREILTRKREAKKGTKR